MTHRRPFLLSLAFASSLPLMTMASPSPDFSEAAEWLQRAISDRAFPGCAVAVGTGSGPLWISAFGHFDYGADEPVRTTTLYDLASLTKVIGTTAVLMRLSAMARIDITDPISEYIPSFVADGPAAERAQRENITVTDLLHHRAGLASWKPFYRSVSSYDELLRAVIAEPLEAPPGERFRYSDLGFILLGEVAAAAGGHPLAELEQALVFQPLGMRETMRQPPERLLDRIPPTERWPDREDFLRGVVHDENSRAGEGMTGHAGLFSTAEDLSILGRELLRACHGGTELFPLAVMREFTGRRSDQVNRALGWALASGNDSAGTHLSRNSFGHTGFTGTSIWIDPERGLYIILLTNRVHPSRDNAKIGRVRSGFADAVVRAMEAAR